MSIICHISTAVPQYRYTQSALLGYMQKLYKREGEEAKKLSLLYNRSGIDTRYSVLQDYEGTVQVLYSEDQDSAPSLESRMEVFQKEAVALGKAAVLPCFEKIDRDDITHLISVSCTGMSAPGLEIQLMQALELPPNIQRATVNFMGCYAAVHALKQADYICRANANAKVLIVCVELCSIHFQKEQDMDNITANLLFADGAAAALVCGNEWQGEGLKIRDFYSYLALDSQNEMSWNLSSNGFLMRLSAYVPKLIEQGFRKLVEKALNNLQLSVDDITHWAIHPGGRKILEGIYREMGFNEGDLDASYKVLKNYGNMSSPTILFVLKELWENKLQQGPAKIFGAAFGPGLTMETFVLEKVHP